MKKGDLIKVRDSYQQAMTKNRLDRPGDREGYKEDYKEWRGMIINVFPEKRTLQILTKEFGVIVVPKHRYEVIKQLYEVINEAR